MNEAYSKGFAVGVPEIRRDNIHFRFKDETWDFPTGIVLPKHAHYNGVYYQAKASRLRKLAKSQKEQGHG